MWTSCPAARAAHATGEFGKCLGDTNVTRLHFFAGGDPTDPFIARKRRNILPYRQCPCISTEGTFEICGHSMWNTVFIHTTILSKKNPYGFFFSFSLPCLR